MKIKDYKFSDEIFYYSFNEFQICPHLCKKVISVPEKQHYERYNVDPISGRLCIEVLIRFEANESMLWVNRDTLSTAGSSLIRSHRARRTPLEAIREEKKRIQRQTKIPFLEIKKERDHYLNFMLQKMFVEGIDNGRMSRDNVRYCLFWVDQISAMDGQ